MKLTKDPNVFIIEQTEGRVVYETTAGERWEIIGTCNMCGQCEVGSVNSIIQFTGVPIGESGAAFDPSGEAREDNPVRPELTVKMDKCVLTGRYL